MDAGHLPATAHAGGPAVVDPITKFPVPLAANPAVWANVVRPTPSTVDLSRPGGDAPDPGAAALVRLLEEPLSAMRDKDNQVVLNYPDGRNWKRVRFRLFEHLVGFRYSDRFDATVLVFALDTRAGRAPDSRACIRQAETMARPRLRALSATVGAITETELVWRDKRVIVHSVDGAFPWGFKRIEFSAAWAAYPAYDKACLIHGMGVKHDNRADLARLVRDRWIREVAGQVETRTSTKPYRH